MQSVRVIAAAVLSSRGLLIVSKRAAPAVFYLPGGKPEPDEKAGACLRREVGEELGVEVVAAVPLMEVRAPAALEPVEMEMSVFLARVGGEPAAGAEIAALAWWPEPPAVELAPAVRDVVIPRLRALGLLPARPLAA
jgi:8-oxo-dGTP diphosphatase